MDAITALETRVSVPCLEEPGPTDEQISILLKAAVRAPDHGRLRPWRFMLFSGEQRHKLGQLLEEAWLCEHPGATADELSRVHNKVLRAPAILMVVAETLVDHRIPLQEQVISTGAAAQNIMTAAHAMGIGAMWRTGWMATHPGVKQALGFSDKDVIVAMIYLGTPGGKPCEVPDLDIRSFMRYPL